MAAMILTRGNTVLVLLIPVVIYGWLELRRGCLVSFVIPLRERLVSQFSQSLNRSTIEFLLTFITMFLWQAYTFIDVKTGIPVECNAVVHWTSNSVYRLLSSGIEYSSFFDIPSSIKVIPNPGSYFELWFIAIFTKLLGVMPIYVLKLVVLPTCLTITYSLFCLLAEVVVGDVNYLLKLACFFIISYIIPESFVFGNTLLSHSIASDQMLGKYVYIFPVIIMFLIALLREKNILALIILLAIPVLFYSMLPVICLSVTFCVLAGLFLPHQKALRNIRFPFLEKRQAFAFLGFVVVFFALFLLFYMLNAMREANPVVSDQMKSGIAFFVLPFSIVSYDVFLTNLLPLACLVFTYIVFCYLTFQINKKETPKADLIFFIFFVVELIFSASLLDPSANFGVSIFELVSIPLILVLVVLLVLRWYVDYHRFGYVRYYLIAYVLFASMHNFYKSIQYDKGRMQKVVKGEDAAYRARVRTLVRSLGATGVFMKSDEIVNSANLKSEYDLAYSGVEYSVRCNHAFYHKGLFLDFYKPGTVMHPITLTPHFDSSVTLWELFDNDNIDSTNKKYFYSVFCKQIAQKTLSESDKKIRFIKYVNASFLVASKGAKVDSLINMLFVDSAVDRVNGDRFYVLKNIPNLN